MSRLRMHRRKFLAGLGATAATLPFLRALPSWGADTTKRYLILLFTPNGVVRHLFGADPGPTPGDFTLRPWLAPLKDYKQKMVIVDGLANKACGPDGTHGPGIATLWTGAAVNKDGVLGQGMSIDQAIATQLNAGTKYSSIEFRARAPEDYENNAGEARMIYSGAGAPKDPWENATVAANQLFLGIPSAGSMMTTTAPPADHQLEIRKRLFTHVDGELGRLMPKLCKEDGTQLDALRAGFNQLNSQLMTGGTGGGMALASCSQPALMGTKTLPVASRDMIELLVMSLACDLTRVTSLQYSAARSPAVFNWLGHTTDHHSISHTAPQPHDLGVTLPSKSDPEHPTAAQLTSFAVPIKQMTDVNVWYATEIAYLVKRLSDFGVLDNCIICWGNELDNGSNHDHFDQKVVLIGGGGGKLKTNQYVQLPVAFPYGQYMEPGVRAHNDLLVTLAQLMGVKIDKFGDAALNTGPITQLFAV
jgi:hypothetical protein